MSRKGGLTAARRSLFKRRKGGRSSSRDASSQPKELASYSDVASLASFAATDGTEAGQAIADNPTINSYVRVERLDCKLTLQFYIHKSIKSTDDVALSDIWGSN